jgi:hypothetical protein
MHIKIKPIIQWCGAAIRLRCPTDTSAAAKRLLGHLSYTGSDTSKGIVRALHLHHDSVVAVIRLCVAARLLTSDHPEDREQEEDSPYTRYWLTDKGWRRAGFRDPLLDLYGVYKKFSRWLGERRRTRTASTGLLVDRLKGLRAIPVRVWRGVLAIDRRDVAAVFNLLGCGLIGISIGASSLGRLRWLGVLFVAMFTAIMLATPALRRKFGREAILPVLAMAIGARVAWRWLRANWPSEAPAGNETHRFSYSSFGENASRGTCTCGWICQTQLTHDRARDQYREHIVQCMGHGWCYRAPVVCQNCSFHGEVDIFRGLQVNSGTCPKCHCEGHLGSQGSQSAGG